MYMKKTTNKEMFAIVMEMVQLADVPQAEMDMALAFLQDRVDQLDKKTATKKLTKAQEENEVIKATLEVVLANEGMMSIKAIQDLGQGFEQYSNQKLSALLNQMVKDGIITKAFGTDRKTVFGFENSETKIDEEKAAPEIGEHYVGDIDQAHEQALLWQAVIDGDITHEDFAELTA